MFERFTEKALRVILLAQEESRRTGHNFVGTEQIVLGLIGEGTGIGTGKGPNTGGGVGTGKGRQVVGNPELDNPKNWVGFVMVQFTIDEQGNVLETKVLYPHSKTTVTLTSIDQKFIANDCKMKFKFTPTSSGITKDRLVKRIQYIEK